MVWFTIKNKSNKMKQTLNHYSKAVVKLSILLCLVVLIHSTSKAQWIELGSIKSSTFKNEIKCITTDASNYVFASGFFNYVAKWNDSSWIKIGVSNSTNLSNRIWSLSTYGSGNVFAAGDFSNEKNKTYVAKLYGNSLVELGGSNNYNFGRFIYTITTDASGNVYAAGDITNANGNRYVAKWNGNVWEAVGGINSSIFNNPNNGNTTINTITTDARDNVYVAGQFSNSNDKQYVAKWNGSSWERASG